MTPLKFGKELERYFGILKEQGIIYIDPITAISQKKAVVDVIKLDEWLHEQHGEYEKTRGLSMAGLIKQEYGQAAYDFVKPIPY